MSGLIPQTVINHILEHTDIVSLIDEHLPLKKQGTSYAACCPFHHEKTPSFNVIPKKQFYYCFGCGASGNAIGFLIAHLNLSFPETINLLAARLGIELPKEQTDHDQQKSKALTILYNLMEKVSHYYQQVLNHTSDPAQGYLQQRGLSTEMIKRYHIGYAGPGWQNLEHQFKKSRNELLATGMLIQKEDGKTYDRYRHRLMFPIHDRKGRVVGFGGRVIDEDQKPKYLNSPETTLFHKSRELYGLYQVIQKTNTPQSVIVVEGYLDVIALAQHGVENAVATLGTATTLSHLQLLRKYTSRVIFCFDGDDAGKKAAWRALENSLTMVIELELLFMFLPTEHDPDSFVRMHGTPSFLTLMNAAVPFNTFFFESLAAHVSLETLAGKSQLIKQAIPYLAQIPEGAYRLLLIEELARLTRVGADQISNYIAGQSIPEEMKTFPVNVGRSPLRIAIALLLQYPERILQKTHRLPLLEDTTEEPGFFLLKNLIEFVQHHPSTTTALLIEQWRGSEWFDPIQKLVSWNTQVPEAIVEQEFEGIIALLHRQNIEKKIQRLLSKSRLQGLQPEEQAVLQTLLQQRQGKGAE